jgi:hypothetical protein
MKHKAVQWNGREAAVHPQGLDAASMNRWPQHARRLPMAVLLLLLGNMAVLVFAHLTTIDADSNRKRVVQAGPSSDTVRVIGISAFRHAAREALPALVQQEQPHYLVAASQRGPVCLQWTGISGQDVKRSTALLDSLGVTYRIVASEKSPELHWVYIPGLKTLAAVEHLAAQLKADGESKFTVSRNTAQGTYYVSLGVFRSEESAKRQYARFLRVGALLAPYGGARTTYIVEDTEAIAEKIRAAAPDFEQSTVKVVDCSETGTG